jgi:hypothetical protein
MNPQALECHPLVVKRTYAWGWKLRGHPVATYVAGRRIELPAR